MELGQKVKFDKKYKRVHSVAGENGFQKVWSEKDIKETEGVFVGVRNLVNSYLEEHEDFSEFEYYHDVINKVEGQCALIAVSKAQLVKVPINNLKTV